MIQKKLFLDFQGNLRGEDHSCPGVQLAAWNITIEKPHHIYCLATNLKLLATSILPAGRLPLAVP